MKRTHSTSLILLLAAASGLAAAGPDERTDKNKNLLRGPRVVDSSRPADVQPDAQPEAAPGDDPMSDHPLRPNAEDRPITFREVAVTIRQIAGPGDGMLNLSDAQRAELRKIMMENREKIREFQQEHREQLRRLRDAARPDHTGEDAPDHAPDQKRAPGAFDRPMRSAEPRPRDQRPDKQPDQRPGDKKTTDRAPDRPRDHDARGPEHERPAPSARERLMRFMENAPPNREAMNKIRTLLTPEQNETLRQHILAARQRMPEQRDHPDAPPPAMNAPADEDGAPRVQRRRMDRQRVNGAQPHDRDQGKPTREKPEGDDD